MAGEPLTADSAVSDINLEYLLAMKRLVYPVICAFTLSFTYSDVRADVRLATVDLARVLNETQAAKARKEKLDSLADTAQKKIKQRQEELRTLEEKASLNKNGDTASLQIKQRDFARYVKDNQDELRNEFARVNSELTAAALKKIQEHGKKSGYDLVLGKSEQERGMVLFGNSRTDITDAIIKQLDSD